MLGRHSDVAVRLQLSLLLAHPWKKLEGMREENRGVDTRKGPPPSVLNAFMSKVKCFP